MAIALTVIFAVFAQEPEARIVALSRRRALCGIDESVSQSDRFLLRSPKQATLPVGAHLIVFDEVPEPWISPEASPDALRPSEEPAAKLSGPARSIPNIGDPVPGAAGPR
jgi:hypothetical protein